MILNILYLLIGLGLILWGANAMTDGSAAVAKRFGVSDLVIGLTVVACGTSAPELVISLLSAVEGSPGLAIGNVVGSNIFNVLVIIGVTAMVRPIVVERTILSREIPFVVLSAVALLAIGCSLPLGAGNPVISRVDGILLLLFFLIFMRYVFSQATSGKSAGEGDGEEIKTMPMWKAAIFIILGLGALVYGGDRFVAGASGIAAGLGVSQAIIGLTIVAAGTSLPELATSIVAAMKGKPGLAVGNVIGSNIFNIFLVLGTTATVRPLEFQGIGIADLLVMTCACVLFWITGWCYKERTITRAEGALLFCCFLGYTAWLVAGAA